jgi:hypothetical protein
MAGFAKTAATLLTINLGLVGVFVLGGGMTVPVPTSIGPPSVCIAQLPIYEMIGTLQPCLVAILVSSILLCGHVKVEMAALEGESLAEMDEKARRILRARLLLGVVTSAASIALGLATYIYVFQVKVTLLACTSVGTRVFLIVSYMVVGVVGASFYWKFGDSAVTAN